jgi:hypothetical protein
MSDQGIPFLPGLTLTVIGNGPRCRQIPDAKPACGTRFASDKGLSRQDHRGCPLPVFFLPSRNRSRVQRGDLQESSGLDLKGGPRRVATAPSASQPTVRALEPRFVQRRTERFPCRSIPVSAREAAPLACIDTRKPCHSAGLHDVLDPNRLWDGTSDSSASQHQLSGESQTQNSKSPPRGRACTQPALMAG